MLNLGTVRPGSTIRIPFSTFDKDDGSSVTMTSYVAADILVYKDGSTTERASTSGFTATTDFDSKTGKHLAVIDLSDDTTADFWKAGAEYLVAIDAVTVDGVTTGGWIGRFTIGYQGANLDTSIATLSTQTSFTLASGPAEDDALNGHWVVIHDKASAVQRATALILDYTGSTKTVTLAATPTFTITVGDNVSVMDLAPLQPATLGRTLVVDAAGLADATAVKLGPTGAATAQTARDVGASVLLSSGTGTGQVKLAAGYVAMTWADIAAPTTTVNLSGTTIKTATDVETDTQDIQSRLPAALVAGRMDGSVGAIAAGVDLTATMKASVNTEADTALADAGVTTTVTSRIDAAVSTRSSQTSVDAVAAVTARLQTTIQAAGGSPGDWEFTADALRHAPTGSGGGGGGGPSAADIADAVWDEAIAGHLGAGSTGLALRSADQRGERTVVRGTVDSGASTTSIPTSAFSPAGAAADQFKGRIVIFDTDTATAALRGEATDITASTNAATPTLTVTALTTAPSSGDTFSVV